MSKQPNTKRVFVDVFTDYQQKFLKEKLNHTRGYLSTFIDDGRKEIAHDFLNKIENAISKAYEEALEEDAKKYKRKFKKD